jgi:hypothetical protein
MDRDTFEPYGLEAALARDVVSPARGSHAPGRDKTNRTRFYSPRVVDVIGRLQAYERMLRQLEKRGEGRACESRVKIQTSSGFSILETGRWSCEGVPLARPCASVGYRITPRFCLVSSLVEL